ncbi:MAG: RagB/SusD family nutrient uptake outer membrane protein, partial [Candidatus Nephrothrix sp. EaCA]
EALNEQGKSEDALKEVNKVRLRAGLDGLELTLDQTKTRAAIKKERRLELCYEGHRWPDLVRWGDFMDVLNAFNTKYWRSAFPPKEFNKLFPIPNREIVINPALAPNNEGY